MVNCDVQTSYRCLKLSEFNQETISEVSSDEVLGLETNFSIFNFVCFDFRRERCDPETRGSVGSDRTLLDAKPLNIAVTHMSSVWVDTCSKTNNGST